VLSPSTAALDRGRKLELSRQEGVSHAWLVDPRAHTLEVYRRGKKGWRLAARHGGEVEVHAGSRALSSWTVTRSSHPRTSAVRMSFQWV
jgi:Uma2 family endonuclease